MKDGDAKFNPDRESELLANVLNTDNGKRGQILLHPLVQIFLHEKWKKMRCLVFLSMFYHVSSSKLQIQELQTTTRYILISIYLA